LTLVAGALLITVATQDLTLAMISGSLIGFLAGAIWLPHRPLPFRGVRQSALGVAVGLLTLAAVSALAERVPHGPLMVLLEVSALWIVALWCYPHVILQLWPAPSD